MASDAPAVSSCVEVDIRSFRTACGCVVDPPRPTAGWRWWESNPLRPRCKRGARRQSFIPGVVVLPTTGRAYGSAWPPGEMRADGVEPSQPGACPQMRDPLKLEPTVP